MEIAPDIAQYIKTDSGKLRQVLINLLGNAIKFTQQGEVILRAYTQPLLTKVMLNIEVVDSGVGVAEDKQEELFKPFVQLVQENSDTKGTGLGLAISKSLVELMGGCIGITSILGVGSTFKIEIPVAAASIDNITVEEEWHPVKSIAPDQPPWRLLVVDDNADNRLLLATILIEVGFQVREAENGQQAIHVFEQWRPHLIWMDMRMPVMDGYEATAKIRQLEGGNAVKIVALTASAFREQHSRIINAGCDAVLHKPFHIPEIFAELTKHLEVKFVYLDTPVLVTSPIRETTVKMLAKLPLALRQQLHEAALNLDTEETDAIITQIRLLAPEAGEGLQGLAQQYQFDQIIRLIEVVDGQ
jgi:CheY-like chemotaxis protein